MLLRNRRPVVHLPLAHEGRVQPREVADRFFVGEGAQSLGERREARLAAHEDGRPDHLAQIKIGRLLKMRMLYAGTFYYDANAALDDLREAVATLVEVDRIARRVLGNSHPLTGTVGRVLGNARAAFRARETPSTGSA